MNAQTSITDLLKMADMIGTGYLSDLSDEDLMRRPHPNCNHINWQVGHLIAAENQMMNPIVGSMPPLPAGFLERYAKEKSASNNPKDFCTKDELLKAYQAQRAATLAALEKTSDRELDKATGVDYAPTVGAMFAMQGSHWLMHCGQWVIVRRELGHPPMF